MIVLVGTNMESEDIVFIGKKPIMNYVLTVTTHLNATDGPICIKARGKAISRAVDVAEIVRNRYVKEAEVKDIRIKTENLTREDGGTSNVSSIEIFMQKQKA